MTKNNNDKPEYDYKNIRNPRVIAERIIPVHKATSGAFLNQNIELLAPLPCIVILVHGVNDVGEAFPELDKQLCAGLNERLGRDDLFPNRWENHKLHDGETCSHTSVPRAGRSPVIPFYWGYRPVNMKTYIEDHQRYEKELRELRNAAELPYDAYVNEKAKRAGLTGGENQDQFKNWLDAMFSKNGGVFPNATTNIPDMYGPGSKSFGNWVGKVTTSSHYEAAIYDNPHRIYMVLAARRLANLIIKIRETEASKDDVINIIAHSQGTLITMLANFMVAVEGAGGKRFRPVDCVIFNNSPYSLEEPTVERSQNNGLGIQSEQARLETLANFTSLMREGQQQQTCQHNEDSMWGNGCLWDRQIWQQEGYGRDNFGRVWNYFTPHDQVVSLLNVQGIGWQGVPDKAMTALGANFYQRVFFEDRLVGDEPGEFRINSQPLFGSNSAEIATAYLRRKEESKTAKSALCADFGSRARTINGERLPNPFIFKQGGSLTVSSANRDSYISAMASDDAVMMHTLARPESLAWKNPAEHYTTAVTRSLLSEEIDGLNRHYEGQYPLPFIRANFTHDPNTILAWRRMTREEMLNSVPELAENNQHSAILADPNVPRNVMAYDLAVGDCVAFELENKWSEPFWDDLLILADWRDRDNKAEERQYYEKGILPEEIKRMMNRVEKAPKGVVNQLSILNNSIGILAIHRKNNGDPIWPMPAPDTKTKE